MIVWEKRTSDVANLFNPAFCGEIIRRSVFSYSEERQAGMPYSIAFLILPIILHRQTRELVKVQQRQLHLLIQNNQTFRMDFAQRAKNLLPVTKEAVAFLLQSKKITFDECGNLTLIDQKNLNFVPKGDEVKDCFLKAGTIGRLFAKAGVPFNIFAMLGVKP